jgi:hypothetical protein
MPFHIVDDFLIHPNNANLHPVLLVMAHGSIYLNPCIYTCPPRQTPPLSLSQGTPMDVNHTKTLMSLPHSCYWCGYPGHISRDCPTQYDIHLMTTDEQDEFIEQIIANHDTVRPYCPKEITST